MKRVGLPLFLEFSEFEVTVPTSLLRASHEFVTGEAGLTFLPRTILGDADPDEFEVFIIPSGDMVHLRDTQLLFSLRRGHV